MRFIWEMYQIILYAPTNKPPSKKHQNKSVPRGLLEDLRYNVLCVNALSLSCFCTIVLDRILVNSFL